MIRAILFDMGGTLDGDGLHWLDRFATLYASSRLTLTRDRIRAAFDDAEQRAQQDEFMAKATLTQMVSRHVGWQFEFLGLRDTALQQSIVKSFVSAVHLSASANAPILASLHGTGFQLGVVS